MFSDNNNTAYYDKSEVKVKRRTGVKLIQVCTDIAKK